MKIARYVPIPFPGLGSWIFLVLARDTEEQFAWVEGDDHKIGDLLDLEETGNPWAVAYVSDWKFESNGQEVSTVEQ